MTEVKSDRVPKTRRQKGLGSIYAARTVLDAKGRPKVISWAIAYRRPDGKRQREFFRSKLLAQQALEKRNGAKAMGLPVVPRAEKTTFEHGVEMIKDDYQVTGKKTWHNVEQKIRLHLEPVFRGQPLISITPDQTVHYAAERQKAGASNAQVNRELQILKRILSLAVRSGKLAARPHIALLREDNVRAGFFDADQVDSVCAHLSAEISPVIRFAFITGWRLVSEILPLQWHQVDFDANEVRLNAGTTKNREGRVFRMTSELRAILQAQHVQHEALKKKDHLVPHVFVRMVAECRGGEKKPQAILSINKAFKAACKAAGLPGRIPHDLRRSAVRTFVRAGIPERVAMALSGHKTRSVFERYNVVAEGDLQAAADRLDLAVASKAKRDTA